MRWVIWLVILFVVAALAAGTLGNNDGVVSIYWSPWRVDLSLNLFLLGIVVTGALTYVAVGTLNRLIGLPERARAWRLQRRERAAQGALREAIGLLYAGRYSRAHKAAQRALEIQALTPELTADGEFATLAHLLAASSLHRLQDRSRRDDQLGRALAALGPKSAHLPVAEGARLLAAEWAIDDREAGRALEQLGMLPAGVARRTQALRLRLQAARLARQPLEALRTARLLAKHQGIAPVAAHGILRSLAIEVLDTARDADQLRRIWSQLDAADRRDPVVTARAASRCAELDCIVDGRAWLRPHWTGLAKLGERERAAVLKAFIDLLPGLPVDWLPLLEESVAAQPADMPLTHAVGRAMAERQLWGRARRLLETVAQSPQAEPSHRQDAWRWLGRIADREGDEAQAQRCYREAAQFF